MIKLHCSTPARRCFALLTPLLAFANPLASQASVHAVSPSYDSKSAPSAFALPGIDGPSRQQIMVGSSRLKGIVDHTISEIIFRRDFSVGRSLKGGSINLQIRLSRGAREPARASRDMTKNSTQSKLVFSGDVVLPNSPALGSNRYDPWGPSNSVHIKFTKPFIYSGGALCIDITGRPVANKNPGLWRLDYELGFRGGSATPFGKSCWGMAHNGISLRANRLRLQIGSTMSVTAIGRDRASPLLLIGASDYPAGIDLSPMGALGCRRYVNYQVIVPLRYTSIGSNTKVGSLRFESVIPVNKTLLRARFFIQVVDFERNLPKSEWTNSAALTTSNGLALTIASFPPTLGMSIITSRTVGPKQPIPTTGATNVELGPVMRFVTTPKK